MSIPNEKVFIVFMNRQKLKYMIIAILCDDRQLQNYYKIVKNMPTEAFIALENVGIYIDTLFIINDCVVMTIFTTESRLWRLKFAY